MRDEILKKKLYNSLKELGLDDFEFEVYMQLLAYGPGSARVHAESFKCSRPTVYKALRSLEQKGLVTADRNNSYARTFMAAPPTIVLGKIKEKEERCLALDGELRSGMSDLLALYNRGKEPTTTTMVRGAVQMRALYASLHEEEKNEVRHFGSLRAGTANLSLVLGKEGGKVGRARIRREIPVKTLIPPTHANVARKNMKDELREVRVASGAKPFTGLFHVFSKQIVYWQPKSLLALVIDDSNWSEMMRSMFDALWTSSDQFEPTAPAQLKR